MPDSDYGTRWHAAWNQLHHPQGLGTSKMPKYPGVYRYGHPMRYKRSRQTTYGKAMTTKRRRSTRKGRAKVAPGVEVDYFDSTRAGIVLGSSWLLVDPPTILCLSAAPQGASEQTRAGMQMSMLSLHLHGELSIPGLEAQTDPLGDIRVRIIIFIDNETNGAVPIPIQVMETAIAENVLNFRNLENTTRFKFLSDKTVILNAREMAQGAVNLFSWGEKKMQWSFNKNFNPPLIIKYKAATSTGVIANITRNSIHIMAIADPATTVLLEYSARMRYIS